MAPTPNNTQSTRVPARLATDQASGSPAREEDSIRSGQQEVAKWKEAHQFEAIQCQFKFARPDLRATMLRPEDRQLQYIANDFLNVDSDDSPRYVTVLPGPHIQGHKHKTPCCRLAIGCSPQGLEALKPDPLLKNLRAIMTESNPSPPAPSTIKQVRVK